MLVGSFRQNNDELISTQTTNRIGFTQCGWNALGNLDQNLITDRMTQRIVDFFEPVQIQHEDSHHFLVAVSVTYGLTQSFHDQRTIGQAG